RKLVFLGEMTDPAKIKDHDRLQRMLPCRAEYAVVDKLHKTEKSDDRGNVKNGGTLPSHLRRPDNIDGKHWRCDNRVWPKQNTKGAQHERDDLDRHAHFSASGPQQRKSARRRAAR